MIPGRRRALLPGVRARIVDPASGIGRGPGGDRGAVGPHPGGDGRLSRHDPAATAATIDSEGWLHTGDIARFDADGAVFIADRVKELIKVQGLPGRTRPSWKPCCATHPGVADAAVIGVPTSGQASGPRRSSCGQPVCRSARTRWSPTSPSGCRAQADPRGRVHRHDPDFARR